MNELYLTPELVKKTYTYKTKKKSLSGAIIVFFALLFTCGIPVLFAILMAAMNSNDKGPMIFFLILFFVIFFFIILYFTKSLKAMQKNAEDYVLFHADVADYKIYSQSRGKYGSALHLGVDLTFETPSGKLVHKQVDYCLDSEVTDISKLEHLDITVGYDEKLDRFLVLTDLSKMFNPYEDCEDNTFFDIFSR